MFWFLFAEEKSTTTLEDGSKMVGNKNSTDLDSTSSPKTMQSTVLFSAGAAVSNCCKTHRVIIAAAVMFLMSMVSNY